MQSLNLSGYELKVAESIDRNKLFSSMTYSYSFLGKNSIGEIYHSTPWDIKLEFGDRLDHIIETGTM